MTTPAWILPISYSRLAKYERCPAQFKYSYDPAYPKKPYVQGTAAARGSAAHKTMEDFLAGKTEKLHEAIQPHAHVLESLRKKKPFVELEIAVDRAWNIAPWKTAWLRGGVDAGYVEHRNVELFEWKTGQMYDDHDEQRRLYLLFAAAKWRATTHFQITSYYFDLGKKKELEMHRDHLTPIREDFNIRIHIMENDDVMAPRPGYYCRWCDHSKPKGGPCKLG